MPLLYYWRADNYKRDLDFGATYHLNQANPLLHDIDCGDSLWAFTRRKDGTYALAAHFIIKAKTVNPPNFSYGKYRVWGDLDISRYFNLEKQLNIEPIIRHLSCKTQAKILGQAFQGHAAVRKITPEDSAILLEAAKKIPLEPRARILPEDILEAQLVFGNLKSLEQFLKEENPGLTENRMEYLFKSAPKRNKKIVQELLLLYNGKCQICEWMPNNIYGQHICEGHHLQWLSRGGADDICNLVLLCPNHHKAIHKCDAPFDYSDRSFLFPRHKEELRLNTHIA